MRWGRCFLLCRPSPHGLGCCGSGAGCARGSDLCRPACPRRPVWRPRRTVSAAMVKTEASVSAGGAGFGAWRPDSAAPGHGAEPDMVGHTGGDDGSDIGRCQSRRRWSNAASACGGVTRAAESGPALRGPVGGGGGRHSCAAATCSRRVDAPLKGLPWGAGTTAMAVKAGTGPASRPDECDRGFLGESLGDDDAVGRRFPVGGIIFPH